MHGRRVYGPDKLPAMRIRREFYNDRIFGGGGEADDARKLRGDDVGMSEGDSIIHRRVRAFARRGTHN